jgi:hypothetical protein
LRPKDRSRGRETGHHHRVTEVVLACIGGLAAGYALRCWRPWPRLVSWAQTRESGAGWWAAQLVLAAALALMWGLHPFRSRANARTWRQAPTRAAAPVLEPQWAERRTR